MELYIQIKDGEPYEHPIFGDNFRAAYPEVDTTNLPPEFARFIRVSQNVTPGFYQVPYHQYEWVGDTVQDVWHLREMSEEERIEKNTAVASQISATVDFYRNETEKRLSNEADAEKISILQAYLDELNSWTIGDITTDVVPVPPNFREL